jgi:outer membrane protein TolC
MAMRVTEMPPLRSFRLTLIAGAAALLAGCAVGPNYARPQLPTPEQFRFVEGPAQAASMADAPWFEVFDDEMLQALVREAITNNLDLRVAVARVEEARARAGIARSFLYPQIDGVASYGLRQASNGGNENGAEEEDTTHQSAMYGFQLSWELDLFGRIRREQ